jgi:excisionase family DNA binding protein
LILNTDLLIHEIGERVADIVAERLKEKAHPVLHIVLVKDAATYLGCTVKQVHSMIRTGEIPAVRHFNKLFVAVEDLDGWLARFNLHKKSKRSKSNAKAA